MLPDIEHDGFRKCSTHPTRTSSRQRSQALHGFQDAPCVEDAEDGPTEYPDDTDATGTYCAAEQAHFALPCSAKVDEDAASDSDRKGNHQRDQQRPFENTFASPDVRD